MNRLATVAISVILVLGGMWTIGFGYDQRVDEPCDDTVPGATVPLDCKAPPIATAGWMFIVAGGLAAVAGVGIVLVLRGTPPQPPV